mmetsp:Transcript_136953/g.266433  ORF Transcript_136953/g.266433 Transcript_136953/m.266433 type:complete len:422 (-) Transcript_136953:120-1385(-)
MATLFGLPSKTDGYTSCSRRGPIHDPGKCSSVETFLVITKACFGSAFLLVPAGFRSAGIVGGPACILIVYVFMLTGMLRLLRCRQVLGPGNGFAELSTAALGPKGRAYVLWAVVLLSFGFNCIWCVTCANNMGMVLPGLSPTIRLWLFCPLACLLSQVRDLRSFTITNLIGILLCVSTYGYLACLATWKIFHEGPQAMHLFSGQMGNTLLWLGSCAYMFELIQSLLPIYEAAADQEQVPRMLVSITLSIAVLYTAFGLVFYCAFGEETEILATLNLPMGTAAGVFFPLCFAMVGAVTTPVIFFMIFQTYEPAVAWWSGHPHIKRQQVKAVRLLVVFAAYFLTWLGGQRLQSFLALVGGLLGANLSITVPAVLHLLICQPQGFERVWDVCTAIIGVFIMSVTTYQAVLTWTSEFNAAEGGFR